MVIYQTETAPKLRCPGLSAVTHAENGALFKQYSVIIHLRACH
jgi:hypothetical protein